MKDLVLEAPNHSETERSLRLVEPTNIPETNISHRNTTCTSLKVFHYFEETYLKVKKRLFSMAIFVYRHPKNASEWLALTKVAKI